VLRRARGVREGRRKIYEGTNQLNRLALVEALWETDLMTTEGGVETSPAMD
jgi:hypothetical protein